MVYKAWTRHAPGLKTVPRDKAGDLFQAALADVQAIAAIGGDAEILAAGLYSMLEDVYQRGDH